jgi:hypothetical protein
MAKSVKPAAPEVPPAPAGWLQLADGRRNHAVRDLMDRRADLQRELDAPATGLGGIPSDYLRQRKATLAADLEQVETEIAELSELAGDSLVWRFARADIERAERDRELADAGVTLQDTLLRGQRTPFRAVRADTDAQVVALARAKAAGWVPHPG